MGQTPVAEGYLTIRLVADRIGIGFAANPDGKPREERYFSPDNARGLADTLLEMAAEAETRTPIIEAVMAGRPLFRCEFKE